MKKKKYNPCENCRYKNCIFLEHGKDCYLWKLIIGEKKRGKNE